MKSPRVVSLKVVADMLYQNPLMRDVSWEFIVSNSVEVMRIIGTPAMFISKREIVEIKNHKGRIPVDVIKPTSVQQVTDRGALIPMRSNEDVMASHYEDFPSTPSISGGVTYTMNNSNIFPNFSDGKVLIIYDAIATDEECYPLVPDVPELLRALRAYIKYMWYDILNDIDLVSAQKLNKAETDYAYYVGQAQSVMQMPSIDEMQSLVNSITQMLPSKTQHAGRFQFLGAQEFIKVHN